MCIEYEVADSPELLSEFYDLLEQRFCEKLLSRDGLEILRHDNKRDEKHARVLVAKSDNRVVGGVRLVMSRPDNPWRLPLESEKFTLEMIAPHLHVTDEKYAEIGRLVIGKKVKNSRAITRELFRQSIEYLQMHGYRYLFYTCIKYMKSMYIGVFADCDLTSHLLLSDEHTREYPENALSHSAILSFVDLAENEKKSCISTAASSPKKTIFSAAQSFGQPAISPYGAFALCEPHLPQQK